MRTEQPVQKKLSEKISVANISETKNWVKIKTAQQIQENTEPPRATSVIVKVPRSSDEQRILKHVGRRKGYVKCKNENKKQH